MTRQPPGEQPTVHGTPAEADVPASTPDSSDVARQIAALLALPVPEDFGAGTDPEALLSASARAGMLGAEAVRIAEFSGTKRAVVLTAAWLLKAVSEHERSKPEPANQLTLTFLGTFVGVNRKALARLDLPQTSIALFIDRLTSLYARLRQKTSDTSERQGSMVQAHIADQKSSQKIRAFKERMHKAFLANGFPPTVVQAALLQFINPDTEQLQFWQATFPDAAVDAHRELEAILMNDPPNGQSLKVVRCILSERPPLTMTQAHARLFVAQVLSKIPATEQTTRRITQLVENEVIPDGTEPIDKDPTNNRLMNLYIRRRENSLLTPEFLRKMLDDIIEATRVNAPQTAIR